MYKRCVFNAIVLITLKSVQMLATQKKRLRTRIQHPVHGGMLHVTTPIEISPKNRSQYQNYQKVVPQYFDSRKTYFKIIKNRQKILKSDRV